MKLWTAVVAMAVFVIGLLPQHRPSAYALVIVGDQLGSLAPCGCTSPMSGGMLRQAAVIRSAEAHGPTVLLVNGGLVLGASRQDQLKAETLAELYGNLKASALNISPTDAALGMGMLLQIDSLAGGSIICGSLKPSATNQFPALKADGPFLIGGVMEDPAPVAAQLQEQPVDPSDAANQLVTEAGKRNLAPVLLLHGSHQTALRLADSHPQLRLIVYSSHGTPPDHLERRGNTFLITPGDDGTYVLRVRFANGRFQDYGALDLTPAYKDDLVAARYYSEYLARVDHERLIDFVPRIKTDPFAGSKNCEPCHQTSFAIWKHSYHSRSFADLKLLGHDRDPDCVGCHVVGLNSTHGFVSSSATPGLAAVGCESCHGPGRDHARNPKLHLMPKIGEASCLRCHDAEHSPGFLFTKFWPRIRHK